MDKNKTLQKIANTLYITTQKVESKGLLSGQMGIALFFYKYARFSDNSLYSDKYFLTQTERKGIEQGKSRYLISKLPIYKATHPYWESLIYGTKKYILTEEEMKTIIEQTDKFITDIRYYRLGLHDELAGLGMLLL